jgi:hypothetical protein
MSGVAGGDRINRNEFKKVLMDFYDEILLKHPYFRAFYPTGSYHDPDKNDFGDIDLVCLFFKPITKKALGEWLEKFPVDVITPFRSGKYVGRRIHKTGNIICVLYRNVQIDIVVTETYQEYLYKIEFLNLPAEKQGLFCGLVRTMILENGIPKTLKKLGLYGRKLVNWTDYGKDGYGINSMGFDMSEGQEFEFVLTPKWLELRHVKIDDKFKEIKRIHAWATFDWSNVLKLLDEYDTTLPFEDLLKTVNLKKERSKTRLKGLFSSQVVTNNGEYGTPKGDRKQACIEMVNAL